MKLDKSQIEMIIPHRDPFLLIDEVIEMTETYVIAKKYVHENEYYFKGHFPKEPIMPGVLIIESIAQAGAVCILSKPEFKGKIAYFGGIKHAKFKRKVVPGDVLTLEMHIDKIRGNMGTGTGKAFVDGVLACSVELTFAAEK